MKDTCIICNKVNNDLWLGKCVDCHRKLWAKWEEEEKLLEPRRHKKNCEECGNKITKGRTCSSGCWYRLYKLNRHSYYCDICLKPFQTGKSYQKICSDACRKVYRANCIKNLKKKNKKP